MGLEVQAEESLRYLYNSIFEQLRFGELKNNILTTLMLAVFILFVRFYLVVRLDLEASFLLQLVFFVMFLVLIYGLYTIVKAFYPYTNFPTADLEHFDLGEANLYYYGDLCLMSKYEMLDLFIQKSNYGELKNHAKLLDIAHQIVVLSKIARFKFECFSRGIVIFLNFLGLFAVLYTLLYWSKTTIALSIVF